MIRDLDILESRPISSAPGHSKLLRLKTSYQSQPTTLRLLWPAKPNVQAGRIPLVHLLPVEPDGYNAFGDPLQVAIAENWAEQYNVCLACCTTSLYPWLVDDPRDPANAQGSYLSKIVLPVCEELLAEVMPATTLDHLLLGFSKSGFAALSLLMRNPERFVAAAAWDSPLIVDRIEKSWQMDHVFEDAEHLSGYRPPTLLRKVDDSFRSKPRIYVAGYDLFRQHIDRFTAMLDKAGVPYLGSNDQRTPHVWHAQWMTPALESLLKMWQQAHA